MRPAASVRKFSARLRRRGARIRRSPSTSCSEITVRPGASKPCSSGQTARPRPPGCAASPPEVGGLADRAGAGDAAVGEEAGEAFAGAGGVAGDDDVALAAALGDVGGERAEEAHLLLLALGGEVAADAAARVDDAGAEGLRQGAELVERAAGGGGVPGGVVEVERGGGHRLVDGADLRLRRKGVGAGVVLVGEGGPAGGAGGRGLVVEEDGGAGEVVEERLETLVEEREPVLGALDLAAGGDRLVERVVVAGGAEGLAVAGAEALDRGVVEDDLGDRRELDALHRLGGALGGRVEAAGAVEHVAEEVEADGRAGAGREEVDDAAADGELAGLGDGRGSAGSPCGRGTGAARRRRGACRPSAVKEAAARVSRGGTRWVAALTVVRIAAGREKPAARAARVAMRAAAISGLGEMRS